jgi:hypothetical protein
VNQDSFPDRAEKFSETSRPALEPHPDSFQWILEVSSPGIKWPRREAYRSSLPSARVTNRHQIKLFLPLFVKGAVGDFKPLSAMAYSTILTLISFFLVGFKYAQHSCTYTLNVLSSFSDSTKSILIKKKACNVQLNQSTRSSKFSSSLLVV